MAELKIQWDSAKGRANQRKRLVYTQRWKL